MNRMKRVIILMAVFALFIPALSAAKMTKHEEKTTSTQVMDKMAGDEKKARVLTRTSESGDVTVDVTYLNPGEDSPAFNIKLDTHSLDLDQYNLEAIVFLRDEKGKEYANPVVESPSGSGHHRKGVVRFKGVDISGATAIELVIKDMAGAKERVFGFDIK